MRSRKWRETISASLFLHLSSLEWGLEIASRSSKVRYFLREEKSGSTGIEVVVGTVVGAGNGVASYGRGVIIDIVGGTIVACVVEVFRIAVSGTVKRDGV
ncbi:hypothetical protein Tco_0506562 [Tanacetum coccineum]